MDKLLILDGKTAVAVPLAACVPIFGTIAGVSLMLAFFSLETLLQPCCDYGRLPCGNLVVVFSLVP